MKKSLVPIIVIAMLGLSGLIFLRSEQNTTRPQSATTQPAKMPVTQSEPLSHDHPHSHSRIPAYLTDSSDLKNLAPTLAPEQFAGKVRLAYQIVREIPEIIAQLPCFCYCDESFGHKSLYTCFESDHSAHCAMCVNEALMAYHLKRDQNLDATEIRERIIEIFSK